MRQTKQDLLNKWEELRKQVEWYPAYIGMPPKLKDKKSDIELKVEQLEEFIKNV